MEILIKVLIEGDSDEETSIKPNQRASDGGHPVRGVRFVRNASRSATVHSDQHYVIEVIARASLNNGRATAYAARCMSWQTEANASIR